MLIWNWRNGTLVNNKLLYSPGSHAKFLSDGRLACTWDIDRLNVWTLTTGHLDISIGSRTRSLDELSDGNLASVFLNDPLKVWYTASSEQIYLQDTVNNFYFVKQSSISDYFVTCGDNSRIYIWEINNGDLFSDRDNSYASGACSRLISLSDGIMLTASNDGYIQLWNILTGYCLNTFYPFESSASSIHAIEMISNDTFAIAGSQDSLLAIQLDANLQFKVIKQISMPSWVFDMRRVSEDLLLLALNTDSLGFCNLTTLEYMYGVKIGNNESDTIVHIASRGIFFLF
jgi:WD40 repeat protein